MPLISVIVPVYKVEKYLNRCIESILNQTFTDFEIVLIDDGSPDNCPCICDDYASKYENIISLHKINGGLSDARNYGIEYSLANSDSKYITFVDSDDWIHPQYLELLYEAIVKYNSDLSACKPLRVNKQVEINYIKKPAIFCENVVDMYLEHKFDITSAWGKLYRKRLFEKIHFPKGKLFEDDWIIPIMIFSGVKLSAVQDELYFYFFNPDGITGKIWTTKMLDDCLEVLRFQNDFFYKNHFYTVLADRLRLYIDVFNRHSQKSTLIRNNKKYINSRKRQIKNYIMKFHSYIPEMNEYGYLAWANRKIYVIESFRQDIQTVKKSKGTLYSLFWKLSHYNAVHKEISNDT